MIEKTIIDYWKKGRDRQNEIDREVERMRWMRLRERQRKIEVRQREKWREKLNEKLTKVI